MASHTSNAVSASVRAVQPAVSGLFQVHTPRAWVDALDESGQLGPNGIPDFLDSWEAFHAQTASAILKNGYAFKTIDSLRHEVLYAGAELESAKRPGSVTFEFNQNLFTAGADGTPVGERSAGDLRISVELDAAGNVRAARFEGYSSEGAKGGKFSLIAALSGDGCSYDGAACVVANGSLVELGYNATVLGRPEKDFVGIQITTPDADGIGTIRIMAALTGVSGGCVKEIGGVNNPTCTAGDVRLGSVKEVVILQGDTCDLSNPNDTITVNSFTGIFTSGPQRYDIGSYIATDGGGADGARTGSCTRFGFANNTAGLTSLDSDSCADIAAGQTGVEIPNLGPITIKCSDAFSVVNGVVTAGGDGNIDFFHCETWAQQANELNCQSSADIKAGTPSKCGCGLIDAAAGFCVVADDGNPCTDDICQGTCQNTGGTGSGNLCTSNAGCSAASNETCRNITPQHPAKTNGTVCAEDPDANNVCDTAKTCQAGVCSGGFAPDTTECRAKNGDCDVTDFCTGSSATCGDLVAATNTSCTDDGNVCTSDVCDGTSKSCTHPAVEDGPREGCNAAGDQCNNGASCVSGLCQASSPKADGTDCENATASGGDCDAQDKCEGGSCIEKYASSGTLCRSSSDFCDVAENCTGSSATCPDDAFKANTVECRASAAFCDLAENCTGSSAGCPSDAFKANTVECRASADFCDLAENCTGSSAGCPSDAFKANTVECRASADFCDLAENCTGSSVSCPGDAFKANTVECRAKDGVCDVAENCTGTAAACPNDAVQPNTFQCRGSDGSPCDPAEFCNGTSKGCGPDVCAGGERDPNVPKDICTAN
jgi:hypothetical protein